MANDIDKPTIEGAWQSFQNDLRARGFTDEEIEGVKVMWYSGAMALGVIFTNRQCTAVDKLAAFDAVIDYIRNCGAYPRLTATLKAMKL